MTARLVILYGQPHDPSAFEDYYVNTHIPYATEHMPNVRAVQNSRVVDTVYPNHRGQQPPYYRVTHLTYDNLQSLRDGIESPDGRSTIADLANFATGGATLLIVEDD